MRTKGVCVQKKSAVVETPRTPPVNEEYFEWIDLLESVEQAHEQFVMVEAGAGYGRWSVNGALAAAAAGLRARCIAIEAEPTHARWLRQHFRDNGLSRRGHELRWAALTTESRFVPFETGRPRGYGQKVSKRVSTAYPNAAARLRLRMRSVFGRPPRIATDYHGTTWVPGLTLAEVLAPLPLVDLLDVDIQGAEFRILAASISDLTARVKRVHIGTHSAKIEARLRNLFLEHAWVPVRDYPCLAAADTPYGRIEFADGVQTWINPHIPARP